MECLACGGFSVEAFTRWCGTTDGSFIDQQPEAFTRLTCTRPSTR
jgi:hypothetical protein